MRSEIEQIKYFMHSTSLASMKMFVTLLIGTLLVALNLIEDTKVSSAVTIARSVLQQTKSAQTNHQMGQVADTPLRPEDYFIYDQRKYEKKDYQGALRDYNRAISINPNFAQGYGGRGTVKHMQLRDYRGALDDYNRAIQLRPDLAIVYKFRGELKTEHFQEDRGAFT